MGKLYVMRHSSTYYIEYDKYAGNQDIPLSYNGICDAIEKGRSFNYVNFDVVFTSTLSRSYDTAILFLSQLPLDKIPIRLTKKQYADYTRADMLPIVEYAELNERDYGVLQNMDKIQIENDIDAQQLLSWRREYYCGPEGGETFHHVVTRVAKFYFRVLLPALKTKDVLVVAHQNTIRALYYLIYNINKIQTKNIEFKNTAIWSIDYKKICEYAIPHNALVLAAGKGSRMGSLTQDTPKPLLSIADKPIIQYALDYFSKNGFDVCVVYSHLKHAWDEFIEQNSSISFVYANSSLSYHDSILKNYNHFIKPSNYILIISADIVFDYTIIQSCISEHIFNGNDITVVLNQQSNCYKQWRFILNEEKVVTDFIMEKTPQPFERYFIIMNREVLDRYSHTIDLDKSFYSSRNSQFGSGASFLLKNLFDMGEKINCIMRRNAIINVNTPDDLVKAKMIIAKHKRNI